MKKRYLILGLPFILLAGCRGHMTPQERDRYWDYRENLRQARILKDRAAQASLMEARADALELGAKEARAQGLTEVAEKNEREAKRLRKEAGRVRSGR
jgi:hypothetical protein